MLDPATGTISHRAARGRAVAPGYSQKPENSQPIAPPLALSWQHTMCTEQQSSDPSGHFAA